MTVFAAGPRTLFQRTLRLWENGGGGGTALRPEVLRLSADSADFSLPSAEADWQILLLDDLQDMQEEQDWNALCELIRACPERRFVLLSRGARRGASWPFNTRG